MYYVKNWNVARDKVRINFENYRKTLDFRYWLHITRRGNDSQKIASDISILPDVGASVIAQLQYRGLLSEEFPKIALEYCHDLLQDQGYSLSALRILHDEVHPQNNNVMLVPGCQSRPLYRSRAEAAFKVLNGVHTPFKIVFSGKNPSSAETPRNVLTLDESMEMERYFDTLVDSDPSFPKHRIFLVHLEQRSNNTKSNVQEFIDGGFLEEKKKNHVFLVSSLFHLPRLATELESYIEKNNIQNVEKIVLVGAEDYSGKNPVTRRAIYLKSMAYEIYRHLFSLDKSNEDSK